MSVELSAASRKLSYWPSRLAFTCVGSEPVTEADPDDAHAAVTVLPVTRALIKAPVSMIALQPGDGSGLWKPSQVMVEKTLAVQRDEVYPSFAYLHAGPVSPDEQWRTLRSRRPMANRRSGEAFKARMPVLELVGGYWTRMSWELCAGRRLGASCPGAVRTRQQVVRGRPCQSGRAGWGQLHVGVNAEGNRRLVASLRVPGRATGPCLQ
jgi:hypothetical protein